MGNERVPIVLDTWHRGDKVTAEKLDQPRRALERLFGGVGPPRQVRPVSRPKTTEGETQQPIVVSLQTDYLICNSWDGVNQGSENIYVALPYLLRRTPFDGTAGRNGVTFVYSSNSQRVATLTADSSTETQVMVPAYVADDIIYAENNVTGGTGSSYTDNDGKVVDLEWIDKNFDGRAWSKKTGT